MNKYQKQNVSIQRKATVTGQQDNHGTIRFTSKASIWKTIPFINSNFVTAKRLLKPFPLPSIPTTGHMNMTLSVSSVGNNEVKSTFRALFTDEMVLLQIASYCTAKDLLSFQCVSSELSKLDTERLWKGLCLQRWPERGIKFWPFVNDKNCTKLLRWKERYRVVASNETRTTLLESDLMDMNVQWVRNTYDEADPRIVCSEIDFYEQPYFDIVAGYQKHRHHIVEPQKYMIDTRLIKMGLQFVRQFFARPGDIIAANRKQLFLLARFPTSEMGHHNYSSYLIFRNLTTGLWIFLFPERRGNLLFPQVILSYPNQRTMLRLLS